jgi:dihydrofolate reductase
VPIFVLTRHEPDGERGRWPLVIYVPDVRAAMAEAKRAAGDKNVLVHTSESPARTRSGVLDELEIHLIPVLLGQGRRLFEERGPEHIELGRTRIIEGGVRCHPNALPGPALPRSSRSDERRWGRVATFATPSG